MALEFFAAEVGAGVEADYLHLGVDHGNERQEKSAIEPIPIEELRVDIGGRHDNNAPREQGFEKPSEDHGIGDAGDAELIEA